MTNGIEEKVVVFDLLVPKLRELLKKSFKTPTQIQQKAMQEVIDGRSILMIAPTGTGKTIAAVAPVFNQLLKLKAMCRKPTTPTLKRSGRHIQNARANATANERHSACGGDMCVTASLPGMFCWSALSPWRPATATIPKIRPRG